MKKIVVFALAVLVGLVFVSDTYARPTTVNALEINRKRSDDVKDVDSLLIRDTGANGTSVYQIGPEGGISIYNTSGSVEVYRARDQRVIIDTRSELSTWSGQASVAGASYFRTEIGKEYWVDLSELSMSCGWLDSGTKAAFTGVTAILPEATEASNGLTVKVGVIYTGVSQWESISSGATSVWVVPFIPVGATNYGTNANAVAYRDDRNQSLAVTGVSLFTTTISKDTPDWELNYPGEYVVYRLQYNSEVSAFPIERMWHTGAKQRIAE